MPRQTLMSVSNTHARAVPRPLLGRQRVLLMLLNALGGSAGNLDFQKLLFLCCQELKALTPYEFVPYKFGAFSFTSYADRRKLVGIGYLAEDDHHWRLTEQGIAAIESPPGEHFVDFARRLGSMRGDALVAETYRRFPYYAIRSEIAERVLADDIPALHRVRAARPERNSGSLFTIGYESRSLERYLNDLLGVGATLLCDVRRNPNSRKYGFSKSTLARGCAGVGIRYEHLPELGIASERRRGLSSQADYEALFESYARADLPKQSDALMKIAGWVLSGEAVSLTCYELLPHQCHRHCVAAALRGRFGERLTPTHL